MQIGRPSDFQHVSGWDGDKEAVTNLDGEGQFTPIRILPTADLLAAARPASVPPPAVTPSLPSSSLKAETNETPALPATPFPYKPLPVPGGAKPLPKPPPKPLPKPPV